MFGKLIKKFRHNPRLRFFLFILILLLILGIIFNRVFQLPKMKPVSLEIRASDSTLLAAYLSTDDKWRMKVQLHEISDDLIKTIIFKEDQWFYYHFGVNPISVVRAFFSNLTSGRRVSGASTITMQVARLLEPAPRTYVNKFLEMLRAVQLELNYSKKEILEMYLSLLPYGGNIEGVKSASYIFFDKPPSNLSLSEAVMLAIIPNSPNSLRIDKNNPYALKKRDDWLIKLRNAQMFEHSIIEAALYETIDFKRHNINLSAPHLCNLLKSKYSNSDCIYTYIDPSKQYKVEQIISNYIAKQIAKQITNASLLVIDNSNNSVIVYCGSANYNSVEFQGQVNGVTAIRSPGSTLKPALFALALDEGLYTPKTMMLDVPKDFAGYFPENFNQKFSGAISFETALLNSLNIPAVALLQEIGADKLIRFLASAGFTEFSNKNKELGLSLILGGCGATLEQLTTLYSTFALGGELKPLKYSNYDLASDSVKVFSAAASFIISDILSKNVRIDIPQDFLDFTKMPKIAWKTGTSYGKRDAWAIGYNPKYTIGVWLGNFNGEGSPYLTGANTAVPLLFEVFNALEYDTKTKWFVQPTELRQREVCAETGSIPNETCNFKTIDYYIDKVSSAKVCDLYKKFIVSNEETIEYCPQCMPDSNVKTKYYPIYSPELTAFFQSNQIPYQVPPPHNPNCNVRFTGKGPLISSPNPDYEYYIETGSSQEILLQAASSGDVKRHFWYIDGQFKTQARVGEKVFFKPSRTNHKISCLDDKGRESIVNIKFTYY